MVASEHILSWKWNLAVSLWPVDPKSLTGLGWYFLVGQNGSGTHNLEFKATEV